MSPQPAWQRAKSDFVQRRIGSGRARPDGSGPPQMKATAGKTLAKKLAKPLTRYLSTVRSLTIGDVFWIGFFIAQNFCQSIIYWNVCKFFLNNDIPITVVLTGSMEPGFQRGDVMPVQSWNNAGLTVGDIVVYQQEKRPVPIVHRILDRREALWPLAGEPEKQHIYITKGDANEYADWWLYDYEGRHFLLNKDLLGALWGNAPAIGFLTIAFKESRLFQLFFYGLVALSGLVGYAEG